MKLLAFLCLVAFCNCYSGVQVVSVHKDYVEYRSMSTWRDCNNGNMIINTELLYCGETHCSNMHCSDRECEIRNTTVLHTSCSNKGIKSYNISASSLGHYCARMTTRDSSSIKCSYIERSSARSGINLAISCVGQVAGVAAYTYSGVFVYIVDQSSRPYGCTLDENGECNVNVQSFSTLTIYVSASNDQIAILDVYGDLIIITGTVKWSGSLQYYYYCPNQGDYGLLYHSYTQASSYISQFVTVPSLQYRVMFPTTTTGIISSNAVGIAVVNYNFLAESCMYYFNYVLYSNSRIIAYPTDANTITQILPEFNSLFNSSRWVYTILPAAAMLFNATTSFPILSYYSYLPGTLYHNNSDTGLDVEHFSGPYVGITPYYRVVAAMNDLLDSYPDFTCYRNMSSCYATVEREVVLVGDFTPYFKMDIADIVEALEGVSSTAPTSSPQSAPTTLTQFLYCLATQADKNTRYYTTLSLLQNYMNITVADKVDITFTNSSILIPPFDSNTYLRILGDIYANSTPVVIYDSRGTSNQVQIALPSQCSRIESQSSASNEIDSGVIWVAKEDL